MATWETANTPHRRVHIRKARSSTDAQIKLDKESARYTTKLDNEIGNTESEEDARLKAR